MAIKHIVWMGLAPTGEGTKFIPTVGYTPSAAAVGVSGPYYIDATCVYVPGAAAAGDFAAGGRAARAFVAGAVAAKGGPG